MQCVCTGNSKVSVFPFFIAAHTPVYPVRAQVHGGKARPPHGGAAPMGALASMMEGMFLSSGVGIGIQALASLFPAR